LGRGSGQCSNYQKVFWDPRGFVAKNQGPSRPSYDQRLAGLLGPPISRALVVDTVDSQVRNMLRIQNYIFQRAQVFAQNRRTGADSNFQHPNAPEL
jgi:hypothetical protein